MPTFRLAGLLAGDFSVGEEVARDAFSRTFEIGDAVNDPDRYLTGTAVNLSRSQRRARRRRQRLSTSRGPTNLNAGEPGIPFLAGGSYLDEET